MPLTAQVTIAFTEPQPLSEVLSWLQSRYGPENVHYGQGQQVNGVPVGTIMVEPKKDPRL